MNKKTETLEAFIYLIMGIASIAVILFAFYKIDNTEETAADGLTQDLESMRNDSTAAFNKLQSTLSNAA